MDNRRFQSNKSTYVNIIVRYFAIYLTARAQMASHWERCMNVDQNKLSLNMIYFGIPQNLDFCAIQSKTLPCCTESLVCAVQTVET